MKVSELDLASLLEFQPSTGRLLLDGERMLLFRLDAFATLRKLLYEQLGESLARAVLMQFGHRSGQCDYQALRSRYTWDTEYDEMTAGPMMHMWEGLVHVERTKIEVDRVHRRFHVMGIWRNSYEVAAHRAAFGLASSPVCHSLAGYASGWCSGFFGAPVLAIERKCGGTGEPHCEFEIRPVEAWGPEADRWRESLAATDYSISRELEEKLATIERQRVAISRLSSPIIQVWEGVLTAPTIGALDAARAALVLEALLAAVQQRRARYAILDLTGVDFADTTAADHIVTIVRAVELLGARCVLSGITPAVARAMVDLGVDLGRVITTATLEDALQGCLRDLGYTVTRGGGARIGPAEAGARSRLTNSRTR